MILSHSPWGLKRMDLNIFFPLFQHLKEILLLGFTILVPLKMLDPTLPELKPKLLHYFWVGNLIAEVATIKDSVKKPLEIAFKSHVVTK